MTAAPTAPGQVYAVRLAARREALARRERHSGWVSNARLAVALTLVPLAWAVWGGPHLGGGWLLAPLGPFLALVLFHGSVIRGIERARAAVVFHEQALARLGGKAIGPEGARFLDEGHPYAADLDLFGAGSLFSLLCTAQTQVGEDVLAAWLLAPAGAAEVRSRQQAVRELAPAVDLREELALLGADVRVVGGREALERWAVSARALPATPWLPAALIGLSTFMAATAAGWALGAFGPLPFLVALSGVLLVSRGLRSAVQVTLGAVEGPSRELAVLARLTARFAREPLASEALVSLRAAMTADGLDAADRIAALDRLLAWAEARHNQLFAPIAFLLCWGPLLAWLVERWRARCGPHVARWLASVGALEALVSFATYAFDHPDDAFPEIAEGPARFEATGLTHPLLPADRAVRNDLALGAPLRLVLVSGSNMSGKSTLLRSVGTGAVMALAGCPVRAHALRLSCLQVGASLRARDSLQEGSSRFYAEIRRLSQIAALAEKGPLLFLLDEILAGTNSHDRREGAGAVLAALVSRGAVGLVTSHDLALAEIVPRLGERAANMHFVDHLEAGRLAFDYRLRPGLVQKSNAVELMRAVGLPV
ncbi:MAG TPA: DNA mismatch repair protein MutS [Myxococcales bacterium]|nr:DNA mismatch repair protein MutS [Myxococcales bacterium]